MTSSVTTQKPDPEISGLYLTFNVGFMDPTRELLFKVLGQAISITAFGPGHLPEEIVRRGVADFIEKNGPYDFIIVDEYILQSFNMDKPESNRFISHACKFDRGLLFEAAHWQEFFRSYKGKRVIALMQSDFYNFRQYHIEKLHDLGDYFITWGEELILSKSDLPSKEIPNDGINAEIYACWTDNYFDFVQKNSTKIISCPQFVAADEGSNRRLSARSHQWTCLGADYNARVTARKLLDGANFKRPGKWMPNAFALAAKLKFSMYNKYWTLDAIRWGFRRALRNARYTFTCGSILHWPIRKYFEVPVNGSVLVCEAPKGFENLGFIDKENAVVIEVEDILDAGAWLESDPVRAQKIADAGRKLVLEKHSVSARAEQIGSALQAIMNGEFAGSRWENGNFQLLAPSLKIGQNPDKAL